MMNRRSLILGGSALVAGCASRETSLSKVDIKPGATETAVSKDGTPIAYERWGKGPPVVLVDGAFCSRRFGPTDKLAPLLAQHFTVFAYDRRGRGESGDTKPYSVAREIEDLAAVIDAAGGSARVFGMSSGGVLALDAAASGVPIEKLAVYEAPYLGDDVIPRPPVDLAARLKTLLDAGQRGDAVKFYMADVMQVPKLITAIMPVFSSWKQLKASAPTLLYEAELMGDFRASATTLSKVVTPTLALAGGSGKALMRDAAQTIVASVPGAKSAVLAGQSHDVAPDVLAPVLTSFFALGR